MSNISKIIHIQEKLLAGEPVECFGVGFGGIAGLDDDLRALKEHYPNHNFDQVALRLLKIANYQGIFYKVPTVYDHVQSLEIAA